MSAYGNRIVDWEVLIEGQSITSSLGRYLMNISVTDKAGHTSDTCQLTLDDKDGQLKLPSADRNIVVMARGVRLFEGLTERPKSTGGRSSGRKLTVKAKGFSDASKGKEPQSFSEDEATLEDFLKKAAGKAGYEITIDPELAKIKRDYWSANGESFLALGQRLARENFATFKIRDRKAILVPRGTDQGLPVISAANPGNIIGWNMEPRSLRKVFSSGEGCYLDRESGEVKTAKMNFDGTELEDAPVNRFRSTLYDHDQTMEVIKARQAEGQRESGGGSVTIDFEPMARAEGLCAVTGTRAGVDGIYRIESVTHRASRGSGATTVLKLKQPQEGAGKDERKASKSTAPTKKPEPPGDGLNRNGRTGIQQ